MKLSPALLALLLAAPLACDSNDDSSDSNDDVADTSESGSDTDTSDGATEGMTSEGGPEDFPPVECGDVTCVEGQVCVLPSEQCDYDQEPPMWVQDPPVCLDVPMTCYGLVDAALVECLDGLCTDGEEQIATYMDGTVDCPYNGGDCF